MASTVRQSSSKPKPTSSLMSFNGEMSMGWRTRAEESELARWTTNLFSSSLIQWWSTYGLWLALLWVFFFCFSSFTRSFVAPWTTISGKQKLYSFHFSSLTAPRSHGRKVVAKFFLSICLLYGNHHIMCASSEWVHGRVKMEPKVS